MNSEDNCYWNDLPWAKIPKRFPCHGAGIAVERHILDKNEFMNTDEAVTKGIWSYENQEIQSSIISKAAHNDRLKPCRIRKDTILQRTKPHDLYSNTTRKIVKRSPATIRKGMTLDRTNFKWISPIISSNL